MVVGEDLLEKTGLTKLTLIDLVVVIFHLHLIIKNNLWKTHPHFNKVR